MTEFSAEERFSVVMQMADELLVRGSWCGETHLQKGLYIFNVLANKPLGYDFILYKHGPFSFDLRTELGVMRASGLIALASRDEKYGPTILSTQFGKKIKERSAKKVEEAQPLMKLVADWIGTRDVKALERISTAIFVTEELPRESEAVRARRLHEYKPHIALADAEAAIREADEKIGAARQMGRRKAARA